MPTKILIFWSWLHFREKYTAHHWLHCTAVAEVCGETLATFPVTTTVYTVAQVLRGVTVGRVGVGSGVDGGACGAVILPSPSAGDKDQDGGDHCNHEDESSNGDADSEGLGGQAELVGVLELFLLRGHAAGAAGEDVLGVGLGELRTGTGS